MRYGVYRAIDGQYRNLLWMVKEECRQLIREGRITEATEKAAKFLGQEE